MSGCSKMTSLRCGLFLQKNQPKMIVYPRNLWYNEGNIQEAANKQVLGLGTIINRAGIIAGGLAGGFTGKLFKPEQQETR